MTILSFLMPPGKTSGGNRRPWLGDITRRLPEEIQMGLTFTSAAFAGVWCAYAFYELVDAGFQRLWPCSADAHCYMPSWQFPTGFSCVIVGVFVGIVVGYNVHRVFFSREP